MDSSELSPKKRLLVPPAELFKIFLYWGVIVILWVEFFPAFQHDRYARDIAFVFSFLAAWRYLWWFTHFVRARIYQHWAYPRMRAQADEAWNAGWRPQRVCFMLSTYMEDPKTTELAIRSIINECLNAGVAASLMIGTGDRFDEDVVEDVFSRYRGAVDIETIFVRQTQPGKRVAIGLALRALSRRRVHGDWPTVFMDGDTILAPGCLQRCLPLFKALPDLDALTTDEVAIIRGHKWFQRWFDLRFAQRHMAMQSHALSRKVLTLTGRMSMFRTSRVLTEEFISTIELDQLDHWLWGRFRFLSGDDKSTWYVLMKQGAKMMYVPDALVYTIDRVDGPSLPRILQNMIRWSGNMLRNGARVIALGPRRVTPFIWWCLIDQRLAMWTCVVGPVAMIFAGLFVTRLAFLSYILWVLISRGTLAAILFLYAGRVDMSFPLILYANQLMSSILKIYIIFRLPLQRWTNRGNQSLNIHWTLSERLKRLMAQYLTWLYVTVFVPFVLTYAELVPMPHWESIRAFFGWR
jgi:mannuronan synthase